MSPPMYFPIPGHPLVNENVLLSCPPPVLHNTGEGHDSEIFLLISGWPGIGKYMGGTSL